MSNAGIALALMIARSIAGLEIDLDAPQPNRKAHEAQKAHSQVMGLNSPKPNQTAFCRPLPRSQKTP